MATLSKHQIIEYLKKDDLLVNPCKNENGEFNVQPASYDLRAGTIIWKELDSTTKEFNTKVKQYNPTLSISKQEIVTLQPGQVMFVITYEEIKMPLNLCGTVYAKNSFSRDGILCFTTGHIDPGVQCPIVIRLINLRAIPAVIRLGQEVYTIVFQTLTETDNSKLEKHPPITMEKTLSNTMESANAALGNAFNDISMTHGLVKKDEFDKMLKASLKKFTWYWIAIIITLLGAVAAVFKIYEHYSKSK